VITAYKAKSLVRYWLKSRGLDNRVTAKTVDFTDLARCSKIFVTVHGWKPSENWYDLEILAHGYNFLVEAK
jgi:hypothetical protein